jgi:hypothetical protein
MPPGVLGEAVVEGEGGDIESDVGCALHVVMTAEDIRTVTEAADVAGGEHQDATGANIGCADGVLGLAHAPDQGRRFFRGKDLGDTLEL